MTLSNAAIIGVIFAVFAAIALIAYAVSFQRNQRPEAQERRHMEVAERLAAMRARQGLGGTLARPDMAHLAGATQVLSTKSEIF